MQNGSERGWNGRGLKCSGCEREVKGKELFAEIEKYGTGRGRFSA